MELGYCFHSGYHGKGYAFEAISALMEHMRLAHGNRIFLCGTALDNHPSMRLLNRLGFVQTGTETVSFYKDKNGADITFPSGSFRRVYS